MHARRATLGWGPATPLGAPAEFTALRRFGLVLRSESLLHGFTSQLRDDPPRRLFPSLLPFPEVLARGVMPTGSRRRQRWCNERRAKRWVNELFTSYSYLAAGCPKTTSEAQTRLPRSHDPRVARLALELLPEVRRFCRSSGGCSSPSLDGGRERVISLLEEVAREEYHGTRVEADPSALVPGALWVDESNAALPEVAGGLRPARILPDEEADVIRDMPRSVLLPQLGGRVALRGQY